MLRRDSGETSGYVDYPISPPVVGTYRVFLHATSGNGSPIKTALITNNTLSPPITLQNTPSGTNSWLYLSTVTTSQESAKNFTVRLYGPEVPGSIVYADAVRALLVTPRESNILKFPGWIETPGDRIVQSGGGTGANDLRRNSISINGTWNAGAQSRNVLVGNCVFRARFIGSTRRAYVGLTDSPTGNDPATIDFRFLNRVTGKIQAMGGGYSPEFTYVDGDWIEIERIGTQVFFRRNSSLILTSSLPSSAPLYLDSTFYDGNARIFGSRVIGCWVSPSAVSNLDGDEVPDSWERWVIDSDPEDRIQSIFDVDMDADSDRDGLSNRQEHSFSPQTNPTRSDTDGDGIIDLEEIQVHRTNPTRPDSDFDGLDDRFEIVHPSDFNPNKADSDDDGIDDATEWEIIEHDSEDSITNQFHVQPDDDFDSDGVSNIHESEDRTSAVDADDYFSPVVFDRLYGDLVGTEWSVETLDGTASSRLVRTSPPGEPAGALSHHEARDGTRVRFQILPLSPGLSGNQISVGFSHRGLDADQPGDFADYALAIRQNAGGEGRLHFYGSPAQGAPSIPISPDDLLEIRLELFGHLKRIHVQKNNANVAAVDFPQEADGIEFASNPLALLIRCDADGSGIQNLRHRRVHDPDRDDDRISDSWEKLYELEPGDPDDAQLDRDTDGLTNLREFQLGTDPTLADSDSDGMDDLWEISFGLKPRHDDSGEDLDGDGLSNHLEFENQTAADNRDTDGDALWDGWEILHGLDPGSPPGGTDAVHDNDSDGLTNLQEFQLSTHPNRPDTDNDSMPDGWEVAVQLNPIDPSDAEYDWDYDGLTHAQEFLIGSETRPKWRTVPIPGGLPAWSTYTVVDSSQASPLIGSFNSIGQLVRVESSDGNMVLRRFDPFLAGAGGNGWSTETDWFGETDELSPWILQEIRQNAFGLTAATFVRKVGNQRQAHLRILDESRRFHILGHDQNWKSVGPIRISESGFVASAIETADSTHSLIRWRGGRADQIPLSFPPQIVGMSERGEILEQRSGLLRPGALEWTPLERPPSGIRPYGGFENGTELADWGKYLGPQGAFGSAPVTRTTSRGDFAAWHSVPLSSDGFSVTPPQPGCNVIWVWKPLNRGFHFFQNCFLPIPSMEAEPTEAAPSNQSSSSFGMDLNNHGDLIGGFVEQLENYQLLGNFGSLAVPFTGYGTGFLYQKGMITPSIRNEMTRFWRIADSGVILASSFEMHQDADDSAFPGTPTCVSTWFCLVPDNDSNRNTLPDDWELYYYNEIGSPPAYRDDDRDGLDTRREFHFGTNPTLSASLADGIHDGWKVRHGVDTAASFISPEDDVDGDGLNWLSEFRFGWAPLSPDTDDDGVPDTIDPTNDKTDPGFDETGFRLRVENRSDTLHKNGWALIENGIKRFYQSRQRRFSSEGAIGRTWNDKEVDNKNDLQWIIDTGVASKYPARISRASAGPVHPVHIQEGNVHITERINRSHADWENNSTEVFTGTMTGGHGDSFHPEVLGTRSRTDTYTDKQSGESESYSEIAPDSRIAESPESSAFSTGTKSSTETTNSLTKTITRSLEPSDWTGIARETLYESHSSRIFDSELSSLAYSFRCPGPEVWKVIPGSELPKFTSNGSSSDFHQYRMLESPAVRFVGFERYNELSDTERANIQDGSYQFEVDNPDGRILLWSEAYRIVDNKGGEIATGTIRRFWRMHSKQSPVFRLGTFQPEDNVPEGRVEAHYLGDISELEVEVWDLKGPGDEDDTQISTDSSKIDKPTDNHIAFIEPHASPGNTPSMPSLEIRISNRPTEIDLRLSLEVQYDRGNGKRIARNQTEDKIRIDSSKISDSGSWKVFDEARWIDELSGNGFFGGNAILKVHFSNIERECHFRIGGRNPEPELAKQFIENLQECGPNQDYWFSYAIAKSESKDY